MQAVEEMHALGHCTECARELYDRAQIVRGACPGCWERMLREWRAITDLKAAADYAGHMRVIRYQIGSPRNASCLLLRGKQPEVATNIPWTVIQHAPTGFRWGNSQAGAIDLALNILNWFVPPGNDDEQAVRMTRGYASATAARWHLPFKNDMIATRTADDDFLLWESDIAAWITSHATTARIAP